MTIRILSDHTINQIAAGEVIENPASVVKELIENALDAGATEIGIEVKGGGLQLIRVADNGSGMRRDDALLCLERHATSKIREVHDLESLGTMGFRGEALASIAAVSKLTLITAVEEGTQVEVEGGKILSVSPAARLKGTTVEVRSLFYNVPARKKFQKSAQVSSAEITRIVTVLSLAHPEVGFSLSETFHAPAAADLGQRVVQVLGEEFYAGLLRVEQGGLTGFVGSPSVTRPNRTGQYFFINRRSVSAPAASYAVRDGFGTRLGANRHPVFILQLELCPSLVDVNVHPQKREVRFREERAVKEQIQEAISKSLQRAEGVTFVPVAPFVFTPREDFTSALRFCEDVEPVMELPLERDPVRFLGVFSTYLLLEKEGQLLLVDLPAARSRVAFEELVVVSSAKQGLMIPITLALSPAEAAVLEARLDEVEKLGFEIRSVGPGRFLVEAIPPLLEMDEVEKAFLLFLEGEHPFPLTLARFARESKKQFTLQEAIVLYGELMKTTGPYYCPEGRPTLKTLSPHEIENLFSAPQKAAR
jgi:DNA mismatch repair protein MutL